MSESISTKNQETIAEAFSRIAEKYDQLMENNPHLSRLRQKVYDHLERHVPPGSRILELNAGTGTDAAYLAGQGYSIHSTDISAGMLARLENKVIQKTPGTSSHFPRIAI